MSGFIGEFFGTMILIVFGTGCGAAINLKNLMRRVQIGCMFHLRGVWL